MLRRMISRRLAPALLLALLLAAPAGAQSADPSRVMLSTLDLCLNVLRGTATWESGLDRLGYGRVSSGGRVQAVGGTVISAGMGTNTMRGGQVRLCEITATPTLNTAVIRQGLANRAGALPAMPPSGPLADGSVMDGYADLSGTGLLVLAVTDHPAAGGHTANTSISVIWK